MRLTRPAIIVLIFFLCASPVVAGELAWSLTGTVDASQSSHALPAAQYEQGDPPAHTFQVSLAAQADTTAQSEQPPPEQKKRKNKSVFLAFIMSVFIPSSGQFYNGETQKAVLMLALIGGGLVLHYMTTEEGDKDVLGSTGAVIVAGTWMWSMFDAPISAYRINEENKRNAGIPSASLPQRQWDVYGSVSPEFDSGRAGLLVRF